ncbi:MAG TPA: D-alanine--D-alanine ligase [Verrucomicrobiae bacterium]|jgi:D-alanine-D-alanine ligase|nr:D-alanine--D-alanine ligase [Verrucomicrobiae bacterium]
MSKSLHITVMLGGPSAEREVSLRSGKSVAKALRSLGHEVTELDPQNPGWKLPPQTQVVFLALHGTFGEDGTVQAMLEEMDMPYTGCDVEASRLGFDKLLTKQKCVAAGVPTARYEIFTSPTAKWPTGWEPPVILKPVRQGSSVGLQFVERVEDWPSALAESLKHGSEVLMEEKIIGRETTVGILGSQAFPPAEVRPKSGGYDYKNKYTAGATEIFCPAQLDAATTKRVQAAALGAFAAIGARDYGRVDVMVRPNGDPIVLEVNTLPGMTELSLFPKTAAAAGIDYPELCQRMVDLALRHDTGVVK